MELWGFGVWSLTTDGIPHNRHHRWHYHGSLSKSHGAPRIPGIDWAIFAMCRNVDQSRYLPVTCILHELWDQWRTSCAHVHIGRESVVLLSGRSVSMGRASCRVCLCIDVGFEASHCSSSGAERSLQPPLCCCLQRSRCDSAAKACVFGHFIRHSLETSFGCKLG